MDRDKRIGIKHELLKDITKQIKHVVRVKRAMQGKDSVVGALDMLPSGFKAMMGRDRWDLPTCIRVADKLGMEITTKVVQKGRPRLVRKDEH